MQLRIKETIYHQKPDMREKLLEKGPENLTDAELVAVLLRTGLKDKPVKALAEDIVVHIDKYKPEKIEGYLRSIRGMGDSKISTVLAAMELGRRYYNTQNRTITNPAEAVPMLQHYACRNQEHFICISLNGANEIIAVRVVSVGTLNRTIVHPREVYSDPLKDRAAAIIVAHNHPSGNPTPSGADDGITQQLKRACREVDLVLIDHIIVADTQYYSYADHNRL